MSGVLSSFLNKIVLLSFIYSTLLPSWVWAMDSLVLDKSISSKQMVDRCAGAKPLSSKSLNDIPADLYEAAQHETSGGQNSNALGYYFHHSASKECNKWYWEAENWYGKAMKFNNADAYRNIGVLYSTFNCGG